jgi:CDP-diacylglycerol--serine O-phosphatidyltransferase
MHHRPSGHGSREHRRRRMRRHGRRAYIRSVYFLPSLATLGNAVCGFAAMYVAALAATAVETGHGSLMFRDELTRFWAHNGFVAAAYLIFAAMVFDALDGRLARFTRHTTDFGGQLDSLADVVSFGAAPAFIALLLFRVEVLDVRDVPVVLSRLNWAIGALYFSCAALRLARFNVSNEHGEQHHFSFLGLPSPGAAAAVVGAVLIQQDLAHLGYRWAQRTSTVVTYLLPLIVLGTGLLMVSAIRYPHLVNRYLRGRRSVGRLVGVLAVLMIVIFQHRYAFGLGSLFYAAYGPLTLAYLRMRPKPPGAAPQLSA